MRHARWRLGATVVAIVGIAVGFCRTTRAWQQPERNEPEGAQILTQGPIHEAFAQPVLYDPKARPVVPKAPDRGAAVSQPLICRHLTFAAAFPLEPRP